MARRWTITAAIPQAGILNDFGVPEPPEAVHWDNELARRVGVPAAYDYGPERIAWIGTLLTNWIGDAGFLERLHVQVRNHNIIGDLTTCQAKVTAHQVARRAAPTSKCGRRTSGGR